jgi:hypothetical protein
MVVTIERSDGSKRSIHPTDSFALSEFGRKLSAQELDNKVNQLACQLDGSGSTAYYNGRAVRVLDKKGK